MLKNMEENLSFSVWVNQKPASDQGFDGIQNRTRLKWVDDASVTRCDKCKREFGWLCRIHHCRCCGRAFCDACSNRRIKIPLDVAIPEPSVGNNAERDANVPVRVCNECFVKLFQLKKAQNMPTCWATFTAFIEKVFDVRDLKTISRVCRDWNKIANYHLSRFYVIQYHLPGQVYKPWERHMLWHNRQYFVGHSRWMVQLIRTTPYQTTTGIARVPVLCRLIEEHLALAPKPKNHQQCWNLMCTRACGSKFSLEELIVVLDETVSNERVRALLVECLTAPPQELVHFVGYFVHHMSSADCAINESVLGSFLVERAASDIVIANEVYWEMVIRTESPVARNVHMYKYWLQRWLERVPPAFSKIILLGKTVADGCANISYHAIDERAAEDAKRAKVEDAKRENLPIPSHIQSFFRSKGDAAVFPTHVAYGPAKIDLDGVHMKDSITRPISIPLLFPDSDQPRKVLWKVEDVRRDHIVMNFIRFADQILKRELHTDFHIVTYNIRPTRSDAGFIEMVQHCNTLYDVETGGHMFNFVAGDTKIDEFRQRFMRSCASYSVLTYLLGAGDRHLHNIMLTKEGDLFHIDYGYVMGADPKKMLFGKAPDMRIDKNIVDAFGPPEQFEKFKDMVDKIYNCLRRHVEPLTALLRLLILSEPHIYIKRKFTEEKFMNEMLTRFAPGESYEQARIQIINRVDNSTRSTSHYAIVDALHHGTQTIPILKGIASAWHSVKNTIF